VAHIAGSGARENEDRLVVLCAPSTQRSGPSIAVAAERVPKPCRLYDFGVIDVREATAAIRQLSAAADLVVIQRSHDHIVFDAGSTIVKCGTRDEFGIEAWACERARSVGVPAPEVISIDRSAPIPHLALSKVAGVPLCDDHLPLELAAKGAREAGALLQQVHEIRLPGFGWTDREHFKHTGEVRGKSPSWVKEIRAELNPALEELVSRRALAPTQADSVRDQMQAAMRDIKTITEGRFLHGDLGRMHILVDPDHGDVTGFIDWGDVQVGDPVWDLAITACHLASPSEGILRVYHARQPDLFPHVVEGYAPAPEIAARLNMLGSFYLAYRQAWVARLGPGEDGVPNPSLAMLLSELAGTTET
jgi:aminoglycoside phosphotransferase (APT) family kinase protein